MFYLRTQTLILEDFSFFIQFTIRCLDNLVDFFYDLNKK